MGATVAPVAPAGPAKQRDPWFDNAKMALVTLVVLGHSWTLLSLSGVTGHLYDFLYAWHVPAFVLVTGYLSRSFAWIRQRFWQLFCTVAVPYVLFEAAIALFRIHVGGERLENLFADPHWPMWYLSALFFWRLVTPVFKVLPGALVIAVVISLLAGRWAGDTLDSARILGLLPFFVMGLKATPERLERLRGPRQAVLGAVTLLAIFVLSTWTDTWASTEWLYYRARYGELDVGDTRAFVTRAVLLVIGTAGAWAFLSLVPRTNGWFTRMGAWTLVVYLFHGFVVKGAQYAGYGAWAGDHVALALPLTSAAAVGLALALAHARVAPLLNHAVDPLGYGVTSVSEAVDLIVAAADDGLIDIGPDTASAVSSDVTLAPDTSSAAARSVVPGPDRAR